MNTVERSELAIICILGAGTIWLLSVMVYFAFGAFSRERAKKRAALNQEDVTK